jgi:hypothetical protein
MGELSPGGVRRQFMSPIGQNYQTLPGPVGNHFPPTLTEDSRFAVSEEAPGHSWSSQDQSVNNTYLSESRTSVIVCGTEDSYMDSSTSSPSVASVDLDEESKPVRKPQIGTPQSEIASRNRRKSVGTYECYIPGCTKTFTKSHNLRSRLHLRLV